MQTGKRGMIKLQQFEKLGLIRGASKLPSWLSKLRLPDTRPENIPTTASAGSFDEAKAVTASLEAKRAQAYCQVHRILSAPR